MIPRSLADNLKNQLKANSKIILLLGPRQVGKTTLLAELAREMDDDILWINADLKKYHQALSSQDLNAINELLGNYKFVIIDEAQNIPNIGINLKIIYDELSDVKVIATGSSSLELSGKTKEALTGRSRTFRLFSISIDELLRTKQTPLDIIESLPVYLTFGMYPEVLTTKGAENKKAHLQELVSAYLYKDVLQLSNIKYSDKIHKLLQLLAYQIGNLVSIQEIAQALQMSHETVTAYIDLLEQGFIIQRLSGFSNNPRKEVSKMNKIYFTDVGIRNSLIENFSDIEIRNDIGSLWENFIFMERKKYLNYNSTQGKSYFWRTYSGVELDLIEQRDGKLYGYEIKWGGRKKRPPKKWLEHYENSSYDIINKENFLKFVAQT